MKYPIILLYPQKYPNQIIIQVHPNSHASSIKQPLRIHHFTLLHNNQSKNMEKLNEAKQLSIRADNFLQEGNFQFACNCYDKIMHLLKSALAQATSPDSISAIKQKIDKYLQLKRLAQQKQQEKNKIQPKMSKFGFPNISVLPQTINIQHNRVSLEQPTRPLIKQELGEMKKLGQKVRPKLEVPSEIGDLIVKNIEVSFEDIVGLKEVKDILEEAVIRPRLRPDLYTGIRAPPKGLLLYGPPGNGKTLLCKALAKESECTFFALSASSIMNKLVGQSEKMLRRVFKAAEYMAPSIIFIDEIDSMLTARSENENEASRRLKTQFLVLLDGITSPKSGEVLVIGATNLPRQLDIAAKRRFTKMVYVGNPDSQSRRQMVLRNLKDIPYDLSKSQIQKIVDQLQYYSASQIRSILAQTCMIPLRELQSLTFKTIKKGQLRKVCFKDFKGVISTRKPLVSKEELLKYKQAV